MPMPLDNLRLCSDCVQPMTERGQGRIEGIRQFQARGRCTLCYQVALKYGVLGARSRVEVTDTEIKCMKCDIWKPKSSYKRHKNTTVGYEHVCRMCGKLTERYNLSSEQYVAMFEEQNYKCPICDEQIEPFTQSAHVDHDHSCCAGGNSCGNCVRGILCRTCNLGIGFLKDNPENFLRAAEYITSKRKLRNE